VRRVLARAGYDLVRRPSGDALAETHPDLDRRFDELMRRCGPYTMTSVERLYALWEAVRHIDAAAIDGDVVECGVWRGGSSMLAALTLLQNGTSDRHLWLYDTYEGMSEPTERDFGPDGQPVTELWDKHRDDKGSELLCWASLDDVRANVGTTGYQAERISYIRGKVEDTIPEAIPEQIALLRLDTDWYESTRHELEHLYPRLRPGGVLILDDYGFWRGARDAVDEYLREQGVQLLLNRVDDCGRMAIKPA